jgi:hydroxymethylglutaryl-CoA synthase
MTRVESVGAYAPRLRIDADEVREAWGTFGASGVESKAVPDADEDALTMAAEAGRRALDAAGRSGDEVAWLGFASTTPPLEAGDLTARLGSLLGVPETAAGRTFTGSGRAGVGAVAAALDADPGGVALVAVADCPRGAPDSDEEHAAGAGAAAFVLGTDGAEVVARGEFAEPSPGVRFRPSGDDEVQGLDVTQYDRDAYREAVTGAVEALDADADPADVDAAALQAPDGDLPYRVAGDLCLDADRVRAGTVVHNLGDAGAASAPLGLARALADSADCALVVGYGDGATALLVADGGAAAVDTGLDGDVWLSYPEYLRRRGEVTSGPPEGGGAYVSVPSWTRTIPSRHRLVASKCPECGAVNFPPEGACRGCGAGVGEGGYERVELSRTGTVEAATTIAAGGAPPEFAEQVARSGAYGSAIVEFDAPGGGSASVPMQVVLAADDEIEVGDEVRAVPRRIYTQEAVPRYGLKVVPAGVA